MEREESCVSVRLEVPYEANDLQDKRREDLVAIVKRQQDRWPFKEGRRRFTSKTNMAQMRAVLLNPAYGFTKQAPAPRQIEVQPSNAGLPPPPPPPPPGVELELCGAEADLGGCTPPYLSPPSAARDSLSPPSTPSSEQVVDLYVDFVRPGADLEQFAYSIALQQVGALNELTGEWQGSAAQLVERLHEKAPGIEDATEITYPDPAHPEYARQLASAAAGGLLDLAPDIPSVHIPPDNVLKLQVRFGQMRAATTAAGTTGSQHRTTVSDARASQSCTAAAWLADRVQEEPGYAAFKSGQHHVQSNAAVVASWQFAVRFCERYSQKPCPGEPSDRRSQSIVRGPRIKKKEVQDALGVGSTWMTEAQQAVRILRQYGEGGTSPRQAVIAKCASISEKAGARDLLAYLRTQCN